MKMEIEIPDGINAEREGDFLRVEKGDKKVENKLKHPLVDVEVEENKVIFRDEKENKKVRSVMKTFRSKINSSFEGLEEGFEYRLKVFYRHFPMDVSVQGDRVQVKNFLGEKSKRYAKILEGVDVEVDGEDIIVSGPDKEKAGQTAANIEQKVQAPNVRDRRVFKDGIYITQKPGKM